MANFSASSAANSSSWIPQDVSAFNFSVPKCDLVARWAADTLKNLNESFPYLSTHRFVNDSLAGYWARQEVARRPNRIEVFEWFAESRGLSDTVKRKMFTEASNRCKPDLCKKMGWQGVSDLAGRGMIATYFIHCILVTVFFALHAASRFGWKPHRRTQPGRLLIAVQESSRPFLDATLLFSIALNLAAIGTLSRSYVVKRETVTMTMSSVYIALYGVFPAIVLHSCAARHLRRRQGRRYLWSFIAMLVIAMGIMYFCSGQSAPKTKYTFLREVIENGQGIVDPSVRADFLEDIDAVGEDTENQLKWESFCLNPTGVWIGHYTIVALAAFLVLSAVLSLTFVTNIFRIPILDSERSRFLKKLRQHWWMISATVSMVMMWASVIIFFVLRILMNEQTGDTNQDTEWTFGQILAVATWAPILLEVFMIWRVGPEKGLSGLMSDRFEVYEVADLGGERIVKSTLHLPEDSVHSSGTEIQKPATIPILPEQGNLSDSTAFSTPGINEEQQSPLATGAAEAEANAESETRRRNS